MKVKAAPGYLILKKHSIKTKIGGLELPGEHGDQAPEVGKVIEVGPLLPDKKMPFDAAYVPKVGDIVAYKKYNVYTLKLGLEDFIAAHFENFVFSLEDHE